MKVIIAGTRTFNDYETLKEVCDNQFGGTNIEIVTGCAKGADFLGEQYAAEKGFKLTKFPANWHGYGHSAGPIRNEQMAEYADAAVVFWDGKSKGASNMIKLAEEYGLKLKIHQYE